VNRIPAAIAAFEQAVALAPDLVVAHRLRAEALLQLDSSPEVDREVVRSLDRYLERASLFLSEFVKRQEPVAEAYQTRGTVLARMGEVRRAMDDFGQALKVKPDAKMYTLRGWFYLEQQAPRLALEDFSAGLKQRRDPEALAGRGYALALLYQHGRAVEDAAAAAELRPKDPRTLFQASRVFALAVNRAELERALSARQRLGLAARYQDQALTLLARALEA